ncbi:SulP family inorganic anion transporter [Rhodococcus sp. EPR-134]|uniref:SulP family inorganic anion transporter n=1 Tax=Rhodococcus sp. EPR-134 TaxID=1813675 RepID=UPI0007BB5608|nr:bifunctional SulP family inorganic anion transporter/carbonic anhydrase [Rhodococcus sp. EPR-134]KZF15276.1 carbonic anhydrase [Rhodococcus sp. EPR-134]
MPATRTTTEPDVPPATAGDSSTTESPLSRILRHDVAASLVVFLVALPLSLGIAIASGAPIMAGLIAAVVGGVVAGLLGGSPLQVSGPAAGLTVVGAELVNTFGWKVTCAITVAAGVLQILFGLSRVARASLAISPMVVHAMLAGIGITIALQQVHVLLGGSSQSSAWNNLTALPSQIGDAHLYDVFVGATVIAILLAWKFVPDRLRRVPGPLVAVVAATVLSLVLPLEVERIVLDGSLFDAIALPALPDGRWLGVATGVLTVALIASVESLLSAVSVDKMHTGPRSDLNRELLGQGAANITSGILGGLPVTGVIVRSSTNVSAGARTKASAVLHGVWILVFSALLAGLVQQIPKSVLAGLLIVIGIQLIKLAHLRIAHRTGDLWVYGVTVAAVVFLNLLEGVLIGLALAIALVVWRVVRASIHAEPVGTPQSRQWRVVVEGSCSFLALPRLTGVLASVPPGSQVTVELTVDFLDHAVFEVIEEWSRQHESTGGTVLIDERGTAEMAGAAAVPSRATDGTAQLSRRGGFAPWRVWQKYLPHPHQEGDKMQHPNPRAMRSVLAGISDYHRTHAPHLRPHMDDLHDGQRPDSLFLTCSDSRVVPNIITSSGPGDLFTVRNIGNLVPAGQRDDSVEAALAFALDELEVSSVLVCGHSGCGAMKALLADPDRPYPQSSGSIAVQQWLEHAQPSKNAYHSGHPVARSAADAGFSAVDQLAMVNVALQLQTLQRHPLIGAAMSEGRIHIAGLFFDIPTARVLAVSTTCVIELDPDRAPVA